jgi:hypothetical protein
MIARRRAGEDGQAAVELVVLLPLLIAGAFAGGAVLAARAAQDRADEAARAGAMALLQGDDPLHAARELLRPEERDGVRVAGRRVLVAVSPRLPLRLSLPALDAHADADAGPEPRP